MVSLAFVATIDDPGRFSNSKAVGPALGLVPRLSQSGETERIGRISRCGDAMMRGLLFEAATVLLTRVRTWSWLKAWAVNLAQAARHETGHRRAVPALGRHPSPHLGGRKPSSNGHGQRHEQALKEASLREQTDH
ncbi:hypothetical protein NS365_22975 [Aureimonas ureilytica]|uniref:Transposase IS116/IS110/IS902 C-terminal domain-containing protein n=1 Tax=Aureimonas ureilytica TaxID=401562 RepID=A0A175REB4_9HYPH|nr:hypothetical protein NS365_22975 [Aureimonas ureilytica]